MIATRVFTTEDFVRFVNELLKADLHNLVKLTAILEILELADKHSRKVYADDH